MVVDIPDVITFANFGEDRLRGLGVAGGQNLPFSIDFDRRLYNTYSRTRPTVCRFAIASVKSDFPCTLHLTLVVEC